MSMMASQITGVSIVCSTVCSGKDSRKHQSFMSLPFVRGIHRWPVDSPPKGPVMRQMFQFDDIIMDSKYLTNLICKIPNIEINLQSLSHPHPRSKQ